jgi:hypothetical protein
MTTPPLPDGDRPDDLDFVPVPRIDFATIPGGVGQDRIGDVVIILYSVVIILDSLISMVLDC